MKKYYSLRINTVIMTLIATTVFSYNPDAICDFLYTNCNSAISNYRVIPIVYYFSISILCLVASYFVEKFLLSFRLISGNSCIGHEIIGSLSFVFSCLINYTLHFPYDIVILIEVATISALFSMLVGCISCIIFASLFGLHFDELKSGNKSKNTPNPESGISLFYSKFIAYILASFSMQIMLLIFIFLVLWYSAKLQIFASYVEIIMECLSFSFIIFSLFGFAFYALGYLVTWPILPKSTPAWVKRSIAYSVGFAVIQIAFYNIYAGSRYSGYDMTINYGQWGVIVIVVIGCLAGVVFGRLYPDRKRV